MFHQSKCFFSPMLYSISCRTGFVWPCLRKYVSIEAIYAVQARSSTVSLCSFLLHHSWAVTAGAHCPACNIRWDDYKWSCLLLCKSLCHSYKHIKTHTAVLVKAVQHLRLLRSYRRLGVANFNLHTQCCNSFWSDPSWLWRDQRIKAVYKDISLSQPGVKSQLLWPE